MDWSLRNEAEFPLKRSKKKSQGRGEGEQYLERRVSDDLLMIDNSDA